MRILIQRFGYRKDQFELNDTRPIYVIPGYESLTAEFEPVNVLEWERNWIITQATSSEL